MHNIIIMKIKINFNINKNELKKITAVIFSIRKNKLTYL